MNDLLLGIFILFLGYWIMPTIIGMLIFGKGRHDRELAFTFDDGPKLYFTTFGSLKKTQDKSNFFVLGSKAQRDPQLFLRMHQEGHLIGVHNYAHRSNWVMTPLRVRRELNHSADIVERITGVRPVYYRPPWGLLTLFDFLLLKEYRIVLWSLILWDWRSKAGSEKIKTKPLGIKKDQ